MTYQQLTNIHTQLKAIVDQEHIVSDSFLCTGHIELLEEICDDLESILDPEPSDQDMMAAFGTKWHDGL
tara:strand:+ start:63 stop:269 length:207 start_codon:yes stop_codon:yes gene_type:complete